MAPASLSEPFRPESTAMPAEFSPMMVIVAPEPLVILPEKGPPGATRMPNRPEPLAKGPLVMPWLVPSPVVVSVTVITPSLSTLLLLLRVTATVPAVAEVAGTTEPAEVMVMSPPVEVASGAVVAVLIVVWAWAAAANDSGASAAASNRRFIRTVPLATGRPFQTRKCQLDVDTLSPRRPRQEAP